MNHSRINRSRRDVLRTLTGVSSCLALGPAWANRANAIRSIRLNETMAMFTGAGGNVVAHRANDDVVLVDGGLREHATALSKVVLTEMSARRIHTLFNTHWHPEQTGSNEYLARAGAKIIAHENTKLWLSTDAPLPLLTYTYGPLPAIALPKQTIYTREELRLGNETIEFGYVPQAHTDGDLYVLFRNANVLVVGGVVSSDGWSIVDYQTGGWIGGLANGLKQLVALANERTRIVPANGDVMTYAELVSQRDMYQTLFESTIKLLTKGLSPDEAVAASPTQGMMPQWGDPTVFVLQAFKSLWRHHAPDA